MTQDKARLAADIRQYSSKISKDFEEKEVLSVESDLWKSKFLACSVIVEELARWKASLVQQSDDTNHHIRLLLHERQMLFGLLYENQRVLARLKTAFDPLSSVLSTQDPQNKGGVLEALPSENDVMSILGLAELNLTTGKSLENRLLGENENRPKEIKSGKVLTDTPKLQLDTPAEEGLRQIMYQTLESSSGGEDYSTRASIAVTGAARPHLAKMSDKLSTPNFKEGASQFKCCTHCQGTVHNV